MLRDEKLKNYDNIIMKNIEWLGERYCKEHLKWDDQKLQNDWWESLRFIFSHSFMRGRRDELSNEYYYFTIKSLGDCFSITGSNLEESYERLKQQKEYFDKECILEFKKKIGKGNCIKHPDFNKEVAEKNPIVNRLVTQKEIEVEWDNKNYNKKISLGNPEDVMMVLDVLNLITDDNKKNIYNYLKNKIEKHNSGVKAVYEELIKIRAIADKIATFIIRDIGLMNKRKVNEGYEYAFPVDTWVKKIAGKLDCKGKKEEEIKEYLIDKCKKDEINPLKFAAGLWFLGFHSLDILIECYLGNIEFENIPSPKRR